MDPDCSSGLDADLDGVCDRTVADFSAGYANPPGTDRRNVYGLDDAALAAARREGAAVMHAWPVDVSGMALPWVPMQTLFADDATDPLVRASQSAARVALGFGTWSEMVGFLGLPIVPDDAGFEGLDLPAGTALGAGVMRAPEGDAMSFSCAACHVGSLFGRPVLGLANKTPRANHFFHLGRTFFPALSEDVFRDLTGATDAEVAMFARTGANLSAVGTKIPSHLGLDTSLAQVALSLARRADDAWATPDPGVADNPRPNVLETAIADSKVMPWWTVKHKTRWLADGSIVSGNPVFTNFLWNELGRGTDLVALGDWLDAEARVSDVLTVTVFASEPPAWSDFFPDRPIDLAAAERGQDTFEARCASCHGTPRKAWDDPAFDGASPEDRLRTLALDYPSPTPVMDVGTDLGRAVGMEAFAAALNGLALSQRMGTVVEPQRGYVPPPLDGIWARWPYLHNGSVPTLCALLSPASERPSTFYAGPADDRTTDFDADCVGYPAEAPAAWQAVEDARVDTTREGLSNAGHDAMVEGLDDAARSDLIAFLKTL
jgi:mono/diheme cytochrome c family protein